MIHKFPVEVLENIFVNLDGLSIATAQRVCRRWNQIIVQLQHVKNLWKECCIKEIPKEVIEELIGNRSIPQSSETTSDCLNWKTVYQKWYSGSRMKKRVSWKKKFFVFDTSPISCVKLSGNLIITGHRNGSIYAWNCYTGKVVEVIGEPHLKIITDMALINLLNKEYFGEGECICCHHHIITISADHRVQISPLIKRNHNINCKQKLIEYHSHILQDVRIFNNTVVISSMDNTLSVWELKLSSEKTLDMVFRQDIHGPPYILHWLGFWNDRVYCICQNGIVDVLPLAKEEWLACKQPLICNRVPRLKSVSPFIITKAIICRQCTIFLLCEDSRIGVSITESKYFFWFPMLKLQSQIISLAFYGNILALGSEKGSLYLYNVNKLEDLKYLDISKPVWSDNLSEASIIAVDISFDKHTPCVVATTTDKVFFIHWFNQRIHTEGI